MRWSSQKDPLSCNNALEGTTITRIVLPSKLAENVPKSGHPRHSLRATWPTYHYHKRKYPSPPHTQTPTFTHQAQIPHFLPLPRSSETIQLTLKADDDEWPFLLHAEFTPRGQSIVLVHTYDIYYKPSARATQTYRLTKTAIPGIIYNGVPDWLYEGN